MNFFNRMMRLQAVTFVIILAALQAHAMTLGQKLDSLANMLGAEVFVEDAVTNDSVGPLPKNAARMSPEDLVRSSLNGYSFSTLYRGENISRIYVYKTGSGKYSRISGAARAAAQPTFSTKDVVVRSRSNGSITPSSASQYVVPVSYKPGVKRSLNGYYYRENAFGFRRAISASDPFRKTPAMSMGKNPTTGGRTAPMTLGSISEYRQEMREAQEERNMAMSAMMIQAKAKSRIR